MIQSGGGDRERDFNTVRYGGKNDAGLSWRVWGQQFNRNRGWSVTNDGDSWQQDQGGFRMEYAPSKEDTFTLQGDIYNGSAGELANVALPTPPFVETSAAVVPMSGGNVLFRHTHVFDEDTSSTLLAYYDRYERVTPAYRETQDQYNLDYQLQFSPTDRHRCIAGTNYRNSPDSTPGTFAVSLNPVASTTYWTGAFLQDTMTLEEDRCYFTYGCRLEYNSYGKLQSEPTVRLLFLPSERQSAWMAVSRAARMPTRDNASINSFSNVGGPGVPVFFHTRGNPGIQPENLMAYEIGYRAAPTDNFSWDIAGYINDYRKLIAYDIAPPVVSPPYVLLPIQFDNSMHGITYGAELTGTLQVSKTWRWLCSYSVFESNIQGLPGTELYAAILNGSTPHNQVYLRSSWDLGQNLQFDLIGRYVDQINFSNAFGSVPSYFVMDLRLGWQPTKNLEVSFVGQNLLDSHHLESLDPVTGVIPTQVPSGFYGMLTWKY